MAALSLATDLGMGQPLEQALRTCLIAMELAERMGLAADEVCEVFYVALLRFLGCAADAHEGAALLGGDELASRRAFAPVLGGSPQEVARAMLKAVGAHQGPLRRIQLLTGFATNGMQIAREGQRATCEMAECLALRLGLPTGVQRGLIDALARWDGLASPTGRSGNDVHISARIVFVARDAEVLQREGGNVRVRRAERPCL